MKLKTSAATSAIALAVALAATRRAATAAASATTLVTALAIALGVAVASNRPALAAEHGPYIDWTTAPAGVISSTQTAEPLLLPKLTPLPPTR